MKTIIAGSRTITNPEYIEEAVRMCGWTVTEVVSGRAPGVDTLGEEWAKKNGIPVKFMPADWDNITHPDAVIRTRRDGTKYDVRAGFRRNHDMAGYAEAAILIWDGTSTGTMDMLVRAQTAKLKLYLNVLPPLLRKVQGLLRGLQEE